MLSLLILLGGVTIIISIFTTVFLYRKFIYRTLDLEERNKRLAALKGIYEVMMTYSTDLVEISQKVTDAISFELKFEIGVFALIDYEKKVLKRVAMSRTNTGIAAKKSLPIPYESLDIPLDYKQNIAIQAIDTGQMQITHDLYNVFVPTLTKELSQKIQETVGVKTSLVYPVKARGKILGVMIISIAREEKELSKYEKESIENLVDAVGVALDNAVLYRDLKVATQTLESTNKQLGYTNIKLKELDKLKDDFVSIASHELRTPMTAIRSYAWMALNKPDIVLSEKIKKYLNRTLVSTERLINLVNDMLNISRIESGRIEVLPKKFDLIKLAEDVMAEVEVKAKEKSLNLKVDKTQIPLVFADADKVHQVMLNLVGNSLKFTPHGGTIEISFFSDGQIVEVAVRDNGVGISEENITKLFEKFGRLENSYVMASTTGGTGLGLYISKNLIHLMGGKIWARSPGLNKGTAFMFTLPVASKQVLSNAGKYTIKLNGDAKPLEPVAI